MTQMPNGNKLVILFNYAGEEVDIRLNFAKIRTFTGDLERRFWELVCNCEDVQGATFPNLGVRIHVVGKSRSDFIEMIGKGDPGYLAWYINRMVDAKQMDGLCAEHTRQELISRMRCFNAGLDTREYQVPWLVRLPVVSVGLDLTDRESTILSHANQWQSEGHLQT